MKIVKLKFCEYLIDEDCQYCETRLYDGSIVPAIPTKEQEGFARELGYENAWQMCIEHDLLHTIIAEERGQDYSKVLWDVAHGITSASDHFEEENIVLLFQRVLNRLKKL